MIVSTSLNYTEAFARFGATLVNRKWSVSAFASDGSLVVSLWEHLIRRDKDKGILVYQDKLSEWQGNDFGRNEFRRYLELAKANDAPVRLVIAHPITAHDAKLVGKISDETKINKTFSARPDLIGAVASFDGDTLCIVIRRAA